MTNIGFEHVPPKTRNRTNRAEHRSWLDEGLYYLEASTPNMQDNHATGKKVLLPKIFSGKKTWNDSILASFGNKDKLGIPL